MALVGEARFFLVYFIGGLVGNALYLLLASPMLSCCRCFRCNLRARRLIGSAGPTFKSDDIPHTDSNGPVDSALLSFSVVVFLPGIAWQAHAGGLITGLAAGYILSTRHAAAVPERQSNRAQTQSYLVTKVTPPFSADLRLVNLTSERIPNIAFPIIYFLGFV